MNIKICFILLLSIAVVLSGCVSQDPEEFNKHIQDEKTKWFQNMTVLGAIQIILDYIQYYIQLFLSYIPSSNS